MPEGGKVTRRDFLKLSAVTASGLLVPGRYPLKPSSPATVENPIQVEPVAPELYSLPEEIVTDRKWERIASPENPPASYRQAATYSRISGSMIIHGGWDGAKCLDETWELTDNRWAKIEEGTAPPLSGHKIVETPLGLFMFGGVGTDGDVSNKGYLFNRPSSRWEEVSFGDTSVFPWQGMGMAFDPDNQFIWVVAGAHREWLTNDLAIIRPPSSPEEAWNFYGFGQDSDFPRLFEPLLYGEKTGPLKVYGGTRDSGGSLIDSNLAYEISFNPETAKTTIRRSTQPLVDYAGPVRGGFDPIKDRLVLNGGSTPNLLGQINWPESVDYDPTTETWRTIAAGPPWVEKAAGAIDEKGNFYRFGGVTYVNGSPVFSRETWVLKSIYSIKLPLVTK